MSSRASGWASAAIACWRASSSSGSISILVPWSTEATAASTIAKLSRFSCTSHMGVRASRRAVTNSISEAAIWSGSESGSGCCAIHSCRRAVSSSSAVESTGRPVPSQVAVPCWAPMRHSLFHQVAAPRAFQVPL